MTVQNLWGELPSVETIPTPKSILEAQADLLGEKTDHLLEARVSQRPNSESKKVSLVFDIVVPTLGDYTLRLFSAEYDPLALYPVAIRDHLNDGEWFDVCDENEFLDAVSGILQSDAVRRAVTSLRAQAPEAHPRRVRASRNKKRRSTPL